MTDAEEAQQVLCSTLLAQQLEENQLLREVVDCYSSLQKTYNDTLLFLLEEHMEHADTVATAAYAWACKVLGKDSAAQAKAASEANLKMLLTQLEGPAKSS